MSPDPAKSQIVVAEDDEGILELITIRLELAGYRTVPAANGIEALERVHDSKPAALVLDIGLPGLDGFGVLKALEWRGSRVAVPTLVLTARHSEEDVRRAVALGAWDYLAKPFDDEHLIERVARMLQRAEKELEVDFM